MSNSTPPNTLPEDIFQRQALAESMGELICTTNSATLSPVALQGPWGCGKTIHAKRIQAFIQEKYAETHKCIYWNAANSDFAEDPLPLFLATLYTEIAPENKTAFPPLGIKLCCNTAWEVAKNLSTQIFEKATGVDCEKLADAATSASALTTENKLLKDFTDFLDEAGNDAKRIQTASELLDMARDNKKLVIIVDELDRCRPTFALKMLETIKHLFTKEDCTFILVMNKQSLIHAVMHLYGLPENDASIYLNKFIKMDFILPETLPYGDDESNCSYLYFIRESRIPNTGGTAYLKALIHKIIKNTKPQLREVDKWVRLFNIFLKLANVNVDSINNNYESITLIFASYISSLHPDLISEFSQRRISVDAALQKFGLSERANRQPDESDFNYIFIRGIFIAFLSENDRSAYDDLNNAGIKSDTGLQCLYCARELTKWMNRAIYLNQPE